MPAATKRQSAAAMTRIFFGIVVNPFTRGREEEWDRLLHLRFRFSEIPAFK
jgi:hypothetical protein